MIRPCVALSHYIIYGSSYMEMEGFMTTKHGCHDAVHRRNPVPLWDDLSTVIHGIF